MFRRLPPLKSLLAFEAAARHRSFSLAANELALTPGAISYQVKQLEASLGVALFHRRTRRVDLTAAGQRLYHAAHRLLRELDDEIRQIAPARQASLLTVAVSTYFVTRWLSPRLGAFLNACPQVTVRLQHAVNDPDFAVDEVDLAIRWGDGRWQDCASELLVELPMIAVCAPALLDGERGLRQPRDLRHQTLLLDQPGIDRWPEGLRAAGIESARADEGTVIVDPNVRVQSAIDGHGVVLANPLVQPDIDAGRLVEPFDVRLDGYGYHLIFNRTAASREPVRLFRDWLMSQVGALAATARSVPGVRDRGLAPGDEVE